MMAVPWLLVTELGLYASCFVCGIVTAASVTISQGDLGGLCVLYGSVEYNVTTNSIAVSASSPPSLCYFVSFVSMVVAVVCFSLSLYWLYSCCMDGDLRRQRVWLNLTLVVCAVFLFFLLVTGCVLKIGRDQLCHSVTHRVPNITSCVEAQSKSWASPYNGATFYTGLHKAETVVWVNFFFWMIIGVMVTLQRGQRPEFTMLGGSSGGPGGLDPSAGETDPFLHRPAQ
ncbi:transmembrane protein 179B [Aplochiton taeniatus]